MEYEKGHSPEELKAISKEAFSKAEQRAIHEIGENMVSDRDGNILLKYYNNGKCIKTLHKGKVAPNMKVSIENSDAEHNGKQIKIRLIR